MITGEALGGVAQQTRPNGPDQQPNNGDVQ
jgi:hypothetical protein